MATRIALASIMPIQIGTKRASSTGLTSTTGTFWLGSMATAEISARTGMVAA